MKRVLTIPRYKIICKEGRKEYELVGVLYLKLYNVFWYIQGKTVVSVRHMSLIPVHKSRRNCKCHETFSYR